jgi:hypothetical protein
LEPEPTCHADDEYVRKGRMEVRKREIQRAFDRAHQKMAEEQDAKMKERLEKEENKKSASRSSQNRPHYTTDFKG